VLLSSGDRHRGLLSNERFGRGKWLKRRRGWFAGTWLTGTDAGPHVEADVEWTSRRRGRSAPWRRTSSMGSARTSVSRSSPSVDGGTRTNVRVHVFVMALQGGKLLGGIREPRRRAEDDDRAVVERVAEHRLRQHEASTIVAVTHRSTPLRPSRSMPEAGEPWR